MRKQIVKIFAFECVLLSLSLILSYVEALVPFNIGEVGIKIGLCNIISIIGLKTIGAKKTLLINALRLLICGILFSNLVRFSLSVAGFILSYIVMYLLFKYLNFSVITTSIFGGVAHNIGQFIALIFIVKNTKVLYLMPAYIIVGIVSGLLVGIISNLVLKYKFNIFKC